MHPKAQTKAPSNESALTTIPKTFVFAFALPFAVAFLACHPRRACPERSRMGDLLLLFAECRCSCFCLHFWLSSLRDLLLPSPSLLGKPRLQPWPSPATTEKASAPEVLSYPRRTAQGPPKGSNNTIAVSSRIAKSRKITTINKPHLPHVSPQPNHQNPTFTAHFPQKL